MFSSCLPSLSFASFPKETNEAQSIFCWAGFLFCKLSKICMYCRGLLAFFVFFFFFGLGIIYFCTLIFLPHSVMCFILLRCCFLDNFFFLIILESFFRSVRLKGGRGLWLFSLVFWIFFFFVLINEQQLEFINLFVVLIKIDISFKCFVFSSSLERV